MFPHCAAEGIFPRAFDFKYTYKIVSFINGKFTIETEFGTGCYQWHVHLKKDIKATVIESVDATIPFENFFAGIYS